MAMKREISLGKNRGKNRIWLQSKTWLPEAGFATGTKFKASIEQNKVVLTAAADGDRKVSGKGDTAIIDINTDKLQFSNTRLTVSYSKNKIVITPTEEQ